MQIGLGYASESYTVQSLLATQAAADTLPTMNYGMSTFLIAAARPTMTAA